MDQALELRFIILFDRIVHYTALHSNVLEFLTSGYKISLISSKKLTQNSPIWDSWHYVNSQNPPISHIQARIAGNLKLQAFSQFGCNWMPTKNFSWTHFRISLHIFDKIRTSQ